MKFKLIAVLFFIIIIFSSIFYFAKQYNSDPYDVFRNKEYLVKEIRNPVPIEIFIKPQWIPFDTTKPKNINLNMITMNNTTIELQQIWNRGEFAKDIYLSFHVKYRPFLKQGDFLSNKIFTSDGAFRDNISFDHFTINDIDHKVINIGQIGEGPNSDFSFGINSDQFKEIRNGFYLTYSGMVLYEYEKK
ncbi:hypothetical protein [Paenibacillus sp. Soil787]|uniref:hypothetical protein n=1 Tax=Paenibacillus sp. Soil787 TaxID=1736411 RepID=UPI0006F61153|nr:hypothetical protein [Paenibacillus sp. Soil787]KRF31658.1 hypothetical protein ASG93_04770 [Paenibacillus sp. Soil787]